MNDYYTLDENNNVVPGDPLELSEGQKSVGYTQTRVASVSTAFLVHPISSPQEGDKFFESVIFGGEMDGARVTYATWHEAEAGHQTIATLLKLEASVR